MSVLLLLLFVFCFVLFCSPPLGWLWFGLKKKNCSQAIINQETDYNKTMDFSTHMPLITTDEKQAKMQQKKRKNSNKTIFRHLWVQKSNNVHWSCLHAQKNPFSVSSLAKLKLLSQLIPPSLTPSADPRRSPSIRRRERETRRGPQLYCALMRIRYTAFTLKVRWGSWHCLVYRQWGSSDRRCSGWFCQGRVAIQLLTCKVNNKVCHRLAILS